MTQMAKSHQSEVYARVRVVQVNPKKQAAPYAFEAKTLMIDYTTPDFETSALITIDTQRDTLDGQPLEIPGTSAAVPNIVSLLEAYRARRLPIVHVVRIYRRDGSNVDLCRRSAVEEGAQILAEGSLGCELVEEILPAGAKLLDVDGLLAGQLQTIGKNEVVLYKPRWGAFYGTSLKAHLDRQNVTSLVFSGCNYPNCPRTSMYQASERDYRVALAEDAISGMYAEGAAELKGIGIQLMRTVQIVRAVLDA